MTQDEKLEALAEVFDCDACSLKPETELDSLQWDSMAMLSVIALVKAKFDKKLPGAEIRSFKTISDILNVME
ncbi:MAG: acyl carrier protein [bacterium]|nr:acyl carrier protein [Candidatus Colisoma equi]